MSGSVASVELDTNEAETDSETSVEVEEDDDGEVPKTMVAEYDWSTYCAH